MGARVVKRLLKSIVLLVALAYCSLLFYQNKLSYNVIEGNNLLDKGGTPLPLVPQDLQVVGSDDLILDTLQPPNTTLDDIFISVKTTRHYQHTRLPLVLKTWFQLAKNQTWFFTDMDNPDHQHRTNGHMVNTKCLPSHQSKHLCCKMSVEYDYFLESGKKWFCHFDDDNYVNIPKLVSMLQGFNPNKEWYLGKTSINEPLKLYRKFTKKVMISFWFATGGAGFCISRALALKMIPAASGGRFISVCENIHLPDDVTIGFIIEHLLKRPLTVVNEFHSHLEPMKLINVDTFKDQISFSYSKVKGEWNVVEVDGFDKRYDPNRFLSLHCFLFPHFQFCPRR